MTSHEATSEAAAAAAAVADDESANEKERLRTAEADNAAAGAGEQRHFSAVARDFSARDLFQRDLVFGVALFLIAFALRFFVARWLAGEPVWDGHYYDFGARRIAEGHGYSDDRVVDGRVEWHPWCHYPVGYSAFIGAFYWVFGAHAWVADLANALTGASAALVVFLLGRESLSPSRARVAGALATFHPGLVLYGALVMGEILSALTVMLAFWIAIVVTRRSLERASSSSSSSSSPLVVFRGVAAGAIMLGVGALVRPQALLCAPFLFLVLPRSRGWVVRANGAVIACVLALVPVLPWTARNCAVMDGCALVSTNAGWNLAIGSFPRATGRFETLRSSDGCRDVTGQVQQDRCWLEYGVSNIKETPGRWLGLIPAKLSNTFDHESFAVEYLREARPAEWPEDRRVAWRVVISSFHRVLMVASPLAFVAFALPVRRRKIRKQRAALYRDAGPPSSGSSSPNARSGVLVVESRRDRQARFAQGALLALAAMTSFAAISADAPTFWPIVIVSCVIAWLPFPGRPPLPPALALGIVLIATTAVTHAIFFGDDRYHMVASPIFCLLAAAMLRRRGANALDA